MENWEKIYTTPDPIRAKLVKDQLIIKGVNAVIIDKRDTAYGNRLFGENEVYVQKENLEAAQKIMENDIQFE